MSRSLSGFSWLSGPWLFPSRFWAAPACSSGWNACSPGLSLLLCFLFWRIAGLLYSSPFPLHALVLRHRPPPRFVPGAFALPMPCVRWSSTVPFSLPMLHPHLGHLVLGAHVLGPPGCRPGSSRLSSWILQVLVSWCSSPLSSWVWSLLSVKSVKSCGLTNRRSLQQQRLDVTVVVTSDLCCA